MNQQLYSYLSAFPYEDVKTAFIQLNREKLQVKLAAVAEVKERAAGLYGWKELPSGQPIPEEHEWFAANNQIFVRSFADAKTYYEREQKHVPAQDHDKSSRTKKTSTAVRRADMPCPLCQSEMFREPICRGCKEGKAGFRVRLICGENDDHTWIV